MNAQEIILINSDDEEEVETFSKQATASISILNSKPLDLSSLSQTKRPAILNVLRTVEQNQITDQSASSSPFIMADSPGAEMETNSQNSLPKENVRDSRLRNLPSRVIPPVNPKFYQSTDSSYDYDHRERMPCQPCKKGEGALPPTRAIDLRKDSIEQYNFEAFMRPGTSNDGASTAVEEVKTPESDPRFRCYSPKCGKIIRGNFAFINHVWAHVASYASSAKICNETCMDSGYADTEVPGALDVSTCPYCLVKFETPYLVQRHISHAHSRSTEVLALTVCKTCEVEIDKDPVRLLGHLKTKHEKQDAPFTCKVCSYRSTRRPQLIHHFMTTHSFTPYLMCPICTHTFCLSLTKKRSADATCKEFYDHFISHLSNAEKGCDKCACTFNRPAQAARHESRDHQPITIRWSIRYNTLNNEKSLKSEVIRYKESGQNCRKCILTDLKRQLRVYIPRCVKCISEHFKYQAPGPYIDNRISTQYVFTCQCGFKSRDVKNFAIHTRVHGHKYTAILDPLEPYIQSEKEREEDMLEAEIFAITHQKKPIQQTKKKKILRDADYKRSILMTDIRGRAAKVNGGQDLVNQALVLTHYSAKSDLTAAQNIYKMLYEPDRKRKLIGEQSTGTVEDVPAKAASHVPDDHPTNINNPNKSKRSRTSSGVVLSSSLSQKKRENTGSPELIIIDEE